MDEIMRQIDELTAETEQLLDWRRGMSFEQVRQTALDAIQQQEGWPQC